MDNICGPGKCNRNDIVDGSVELTQALISAVTRCVAKRNEADEIGKISAELTLTAVKELLDGLADGDTQRVEVALSAIRGNQQTELFDEVGKLTRKLHSSLVDFRQEVSPKLESIVAQGMPQATDQLQYVISMTDQAAHKVLELVEKQSQVIETERSVVEKTNEKFKNATAAKTVDDLKNEVQEFTKELVFSNTTLRNLNTEILMAQEFQDLSGQILRKVINLITDVESNLVTMIKMFGLASEKPEETKVANTKTSCNQDDVNELLASLGF